MSTIDPSAFHYSLLDSEKDTHPRLASVPNFAAFAKTLETYRRPACAPHSELGPGQKCEERKGPAFCAAVFDGHGREERNVLAHFMFVADIDHVTRAQLAEFLPRFAATGLEFFIGTTHSHDPARERDDNCLRLVVPLSRPVELKDIRRFRAAVIAKYGIPVDTKTVDPNRLYFMPSSPARGPEPEFRYHPGVPLDVGAILANAPDAPAQEIKPAVRSAPLVSGFADPEERAAALGKLRKAMGNAKTPESRDLMRQVLNGEDVLGKPASQGGTGHDPAMNKVARIMAGIAMNVDTRLDVSECLEVALPSFSAWGGPTPAAEYAGEKFSRHLAEFRGRVQAEQHSRELDDGLRSLAGPPVESVLVPGAAALTANDGSAPDWAAWTENHKGKSGEYRFADTPNRIWSALTFEPRWVGAIRRNLVTKDIELSGGPLYRGPPRILTDTDVTLMRNYFAAELELKDISSKTVAEQVALAAWQNAYDPLAEYLNGLSWDGTSRLETWAHDFLGVSYENDVGEDITLHVTSISKRWLIAAVARALRPGCQVDNVLILEGDQGIKKSSALRVLGGDWFSDDAGAVLGDKDTKLLISRVWVQEMPELAAMSKSDVESVKAHITRREDFYRAPYDRAPQKHARRCIFSGTTNKDTYLVDDTGHRRFWVLRCSAPEIDLDGLTAARDQLWAEAVALFKAGEQWWLTPEETISVALETAGRMVKDDAWSAKLLSSWLSSGKPEGFTMVTALEWLGFTADRMDRKAQTAAGLALKGLGFAKSRPRGEGARPRTYHPDDALRALPATTADGKPKLNLVKD